MNSADLSHIRKEYTGNHLGKESTPESPFLLFRQWYEETVTVSEEPNAMILATADQQGRPSLRTVLLKEYSEKGFSFFTNYNSRKGEELSINPRASLLFYWAAQARQIRIEGLVKKIEKKDSNAYFATRPRGSQLSAWASDQSQIIPDKEFLYKKFEKISGQFENRSIPRPAHWGGYRLVPDYFEFWQGQPDRLHDRISYISEGKHKWRKERLAP